MFDARPSLFRGGTSSGCCWLEPFTSIPAQSHAYPSLVTLSFPKPSKQTQRITMYGPTASLHLANAAKVQSVPTKKGNKRQLTFADDSPNNKDNNVQEISSHDDYTREERKACWWTPFEKKVFRNTAKIYMRNAARQYHPFQGVVESTYKAAQSLSKSLDFADVLQDPSKYFSTLKQRSLHSAVRSSECRGLEKYMSRSQSDARSSHARFARTMVLDTLRVGVCKQEVAELYSDLSLSSAIYARIMADADYQAANY